MRSVRIGITTEGTFADTCAGELVRSFTQRSNFLFGELRHKDLRRVGRKSSVTPFVLDGGYTVGELETVNAQTLAERHCVKAVTHLLHNQCDFVDRLVEYEQFAVAIVDQSA